MTLLSKWTFFILTILLTHSAYSEEEELPTYFYYNTKEMNALFDVDSDLKLNKDELIKWDRITSKLIRDNKRQDSARIYAYLYLAQNEAAFLSFYSTGVLKGSLDRISGKTLKLFFPNYDISEILAKQDPFSEMIDYLVFDKIQKRFEQENKNIHSYSEKKGADYWTGKHPFYGIEIGTWKPWFLSSNQEFRAPAPPALDAPEWKNQLNFIKKDERKDKEQVFRAQNNIAKHWRTHVNRFLLENVSRLDQTIYIRAIIAMGIVDGLIATFDSKYTYWVKRPYQMNKDLKITERTPNSPSYPATESVLSTLCTLLLSDSFPKVEEWKKMTKMFAKESLLKGWQFPLDIQAGQEMGKKIGKKILVELEKSPTKERNQ